MNNQSANHIIMRAKPAISFLIFLLAILGAGAIFGGIVFIISPSGKLFGMPVSILQYSPFNNFLIPGIILFSVLGLIPAGLALALIRRPKNKYAGLLNLYPDMYWAWTYCIYIAFALIIWIQFEMIFLRAVHWSHTLYIFFAIAILFVALLPQVRSQYKK